MDFLPFAFYCQNINAAAGHAQFCPNPPQTLHPKNALLIFKTFDLHWDWATNSPVDFFSGWRENVCLFAGRFVLVSSVCFWRSCRIIHPSPKRSIKTQVQIL